LSSHLGSFNINRALYSDQLIKSNEILILDDSLKQFKEKMLLLEKNSANLFLLIEKKNIKILESKKYKIFFKPLRLFELHDEICKKISNNIKSKSKWKLDRSKLRFYKNNVT